MGFEPDTVAIYQADDRDWYPEQIRDYLRNMVKRSIGRRIEDVISTQRLQAIELILSGHNIQVHALKRITKSRSAPARSRGPTKNRSGRERECVSRGVDNERLMKR